MDITIVQLIEIRNRVMDILDNDIDDVVDTVYRIANLIDGIIDKSEEDNDE